MSKTVTFFKSLCDQTRLSCLLLLSAEQELCVCEFVEALDAQQSLVSRHLAQLRAAGLVEDERRGQWVHYRLSPDLPKWVLEVLEIVGRAEAESEDIIAARRRLSAMLPRPPGRCEER